MISLSNSASHNAFYVERDITSWYNDGSLWDRINGTNGYEGFEGIFPGCYFDMSRNIIAPYNSGGSGSKKLYILGCNTLFSIGDNNSNIPNILYPHISVYPETNFGNTVMNDTNTTTGGYYNSKMNQSIIGLPTTIGDIGGTINQQLYAEFGNHLKTYRAAISETINGEFGYHDIQSILFSENELCGSRVLSRNGKEVGTGLLQFPMFRYKSEKVHNRAWYWTRNIASDTQFILMQQFGAFNVNNASGLSLVRPHFILG